MGDGKWNGSAGDSSKHGEAMAQNQRILQQYEYNARGQITGVVDATGIPFPMTWTAGDASQALALWTG